VTGLTKTFIGYSSDLPPATLDINFAGTKSLTDNITSTNLVTFTRASSGTYVGSDGLIKTAVTNLLTFSEQFDNAAWSVARCTISANSTAAPDGALTADTLVEDTTSNSHPVYRTISGFANAAAYTASVYIKASARNRARIALANTAFAANTYADYDLAAVTVTGNNATGTITALSNGWYRCTVTATTVAAASGDIYIQPRDGSGAASYLGTGVNAIFIWGAQLERSSTVGEYIPTTTTINSAPRFTHNPATGASLGLLVEEQRTNVALRSEQFDDASWVKYLSGSVTPNTAISPDGTTTADTLSKTTTANGLVYQLTPISGIQTLSFYCKANTATQCTVAFTINLFGRACTFDLINGTAGPITNYNGVDPSIFGGTASIFPVGNGWYRCVLANVSAPATTAFHIGAGAVGSTTAESIYVWGAQLETGYGASSYIPTTTAQVTRAKDIATISGTNFTSWYQQAEGTIFAEYIGGRNNFYNAYGRIATTNVWSVEKGANAFAINFITGASQLSSVSLVDSFVSTAKVAAAWQGSAISTVIADGNLPSFSSGSLTISGTATKLNIGTDNNGNVSLDGTIARLSYWPTRLSNVTLQNMTK
jgi:hypothetical protein